MGYKVACWFKCWGNSGCFICLLTWIWSGTMKWKLMGLLLTPFRMPSQPLFPLEVLKTFWLLVLTLLPHWCKILSFYLFPVPNYWTWTKTTPQKKEIFCSNLYKIEVTITFLIEISELPNFDHLVTSAI